MKKTIIVISCRGCPYRSVYRNDGIEPDDWVCSKKEFIVVPNINVIPDWCPL